MSPLVVRLLSIPASPQGFEKGGPIVECGVVFCAVEVIGVPGPGSKDVGGAATVEDRVDCTLGRHDLGDEHHRFALDVLSHSMQHGLLGLRDHGTHGLQPRAGRQLDCRSGSTWCRRIFAMAVTLGTEPRV